MCFFYLLVEFFSLTHRHHARLKPRASGLVGLVDPVLDHRRRAQKEGTELGPVIRPWDKGVRLGKFHVRAMEAAKVEIVSAMVEERVHRFAPLRRACFATDAARDLALVVVDVQAGVAGEDFRSVSRTEVSGEDGPHIVRDEDHVRRLVSGQVVILELVPCHHVEDVLLLCFGQTGVDSYAHCLGHLAPSIVTIAGPYFAPNIPQVDRSTRAKVLGRHTREVQWFGKDSIRSSRQRRRVHW